MAFRSSLRPLSLAARSSLMSSSRGFHSTRPAFVKVGDSIPNLEVLAEGSPANKVNLAKELATGKGLIIGVPGAFSPGCSQKHIPSYLKHPNLQDAGKVFVVSVNDPFVMGAWGDALDSSGAIGIRFLADPVAEFTKALDLDFDATKIFGNVRSKRYALVTEDGKVKSTHIESDGTGTNDSMAEKVLGPPTSLDWNA
ncbi:Redoxin-domain-containing protein [Cryphonectria parasitica EP155]|uniref:Redoxin-domain-containing protein n=1 Tax=Cryphonectria parasitica (strain ATCC 38755 / EP155) TaxID=660469 RepID=A0A9P5CN58_CRYP1|nr:Redoxin-domain-containing protein [Cryphonectria parasitica EP155]KAF3763791.1 Redoxin-domain-containing protein [Cryphonectria parasitica EP155]